MDFHKSRALSNAYFKTYSNGGYGRLPNPVDDDQITTDQFTERRVNYPSQFTREYFDENNLNSIHNQYNKNKMISQGTQVSQIQTKGIKVVGRDQFGKYNVLETQDVDPSTNDSTHILLWIVLAIGAISLLSNTVAPPL